MVDFKKFTDENELRAAIKQEYDILFAKPTLEEPPILSRPQLVEVENAQTRIWIEVRELGNRYHTPQLSLRASGDLSNAKLTADEARVLIAELERGVSDFERAQAYYEVSNAYRERLSDWEQRKRDVESATVREWRAFIKSNTPDTHEPEDYEYDDDDYEEDNDN